MGHDEIYPHICLVVRDLTIWFPIDTMRGSRPDAAYDLLGSQ